MLDDGRDLYRSSPFVETENFSAGNRAAIEYQPAKSQKDSCNCGAIDTEEAKLYRTGLAVEQIAQKLGKSEKAVLTMLPYIKCMYNAEYPTIQALRTRKSREKDKEGQT